MFCPECGMRVVGTIEENGKKFGICARGHKMKKPEGKVVHRMTEKTEQIFEGDLKELMRADESIITSIPCPFCSKKECICIGSWTTHADEGETYLMKCLKCDKNFRSGSGGGRGE